MYTKGYSVNPHRNIMVALMKMRDIDVQNIVFIGQAHTYSADVKYFGIYFEMKLSWKKHFAFCLITQKNPVLLL